LRGSWEYQRDFSFFNPVGQFHSGEFSVIVAAQNRSLSGIGILRAHRRIWAAVLAVRVVDARRRIRASVLAVGIRDRVGIIRIGAQAAQVLAIGGDDLRGGGRVGIRDTRCRVGVAESAVGIADTGRGIRVAERAEFVRCGVGEIGVRAELSEEHAVAADLRGGA
jgi:hypothetical protein